MTHKLTVTRRYFLRSTGIAAGAIALGGTALSAATEQAAYEAGPHVQNAHAPTSKNKGYRGRMFITTDLDFATLSEAAERIFPKDDLGPGAKELFVPYFIDNQLAGAYGYNAREYTTGPFYPGAPTQGYQTPLLRNQLILQGLAALNVQANADFDQSFPKLSNDQKDQILEKCARGDIATQGFSSSEFFTLLRFMVLAGAYSDPIYNGNADMHGWRMKGYPGAQMAYDYMIQKAEFTKIDPVSLSDMQ